MNQLLSMNPLFLRQVAGISLRFLSPETLSSLIPTAVVYFFAAWFDMYLPAAARPFWWLVVQSLLVGRFTLGAANGSFNSDLFEKFDWKQIPGYMVRYLAISLVWALPLMGLIYLSLPVGNLKVTDALSWIIEKVALSGTTPFIPDFAFWIVLLSITACTALPLLTAILAAQAKSPIHAFFPSLWKHPFKAGTSPLVLQVVFLGCIAGVFFLYLPVLGLASVLAYKASPTLGKIIGGVAIAFPFMSWPIIAGRLAGTWVHFHPIDPDIDLSVEDPDQIHAPPVIKATTAIPVVANVIASEPGAASAAPAPHPADPAPVPTSPTSAIAALSSDVDLAAEAIGKLRTLADTDPAGALKKLQAAKKKLADEPRILGLEVELILANGNKSKALSLAVPAVQALLKSPHHADIPPVFTALGKERHDLPWDSAQLDALVKVFTDVKDFKEAGWCAHTAELQTGNVGRAGKRLIQIADLATAAKDYESAKGLFKYYRKHHPDGPFASYVEKALEFIAKQ